MKLRKFKGRIKENQMLQIKELVEACLEDKEGLYILRDMYEEVREQVDLLLITTDWETIKQLRQDIYLTII